MPSFRMIALPLVCMAATAQADETRQLDAHEHGIGALNVAFDGNTVAMEFQAPGADIVGFEYEATSQEDRTAIEDAVATLAKPLDLFQVPAAAECSVTQASAALITEDADNHEEHHDHDDHDDVDHSEHDHEKHAEHDDHDDHDHAEAPSHTEFEGAYTLSCANPAAIDTMTFAYFDVFPNALKIEVQIITPTGAKAYEVERDAPELALSGLF